MNGKMFHGLLLNKGFMKDFVRPYSFLKNKIYSKNKFLMGKVERF